MFVGTDVEPGGDRDAAAAAITALAPAIEMVDLPSPPSDPGAVLEGGFAHRAVILGAQDASRAGGDFSGLSTTVTANGEPFAAEDDPERAVGGDILGLVFPLTTEAWQFFPYSRRSKHAIPSQRRSGFTLTWAIGVLERELRRRFPDVGILTSATRLGPGGGRHRCLLACTTPYAVSFDDDSYPVDSDFFSQVDRLFSDYPKAAIFGASIWHRHEREKIRTETMISLPKLHRMWLCDPIGGIPRKFADYLPRPVAYGMEENDVSLQLFAAGWQIYEVGDWRVFHDTNLKHHQTPEVTSGSYNECRLVCILTLSAYWMGMGCATGGK